MNLPAEFIDEFPHRGEWLSPAEPPALHAWDISVVLPDLTATHAVYMGDYWWTSTKGRIQPLAWRPLLVKNIAVC